mgnify:CR=1 FL=1
MTLSEVVAPLDAIATLIVSRRADVLLRERGGRAYSGPLTEEEFNVLTDGLRAMRTNTVLMEQGLIKRQ